MYRVNWYYICVGLICVIKKTMTHLVENDVTNDGSWQISILVTDLNIQRNLYVTGSLHIGGLMLRLVDEVGSSYTVLILFRLWMNLSKNMPSVFWCRICLLLDLYLILVTIAFSLLKQNGSTFSYQIMVSLIKYLITRKMYKLHLIKLKFQ